MLGPTLYGWLLVVGTLDAFLVAPALRRADTVRPQAQTRTQTRGRLISTECVLIGLVTCAYGRLVLPLALNGIVIAGLILIDLGLTGYALTLPDTNLIAVARRRWRS